MIVVDTSVLAYLFLPGERTARARAALRRDAEWRVPLLWRSEFHNVLALYMHQHHLALEQALRLATEAEQLLQGREYLVSAAHVLALAAQSQCPAYDCEFVALAQGLSIKLVTTKGHILQSFPDVALSLGQFVGET